MIFQDLTRTLDDLDGPVDVFFRDDDAGWAEEELLTLCDLFADRAPLDLAVIPMAIEPSLASVLLNHPGSPGLHQHGYAHSNNQVVGRKAEFADGRPPAVIGVEIEAGQARLRQLFGDRLDPIFTPPWNRCGLAAVDALLDLGITTLSRDVGATPLAHSGLVELPVSVDWTRYSRRRDPIRPEEWHELDAALAGAVACSPVGVMLHHQVMDDDDLAALDELINLLSGHRRVELKTMSSLVGELIGAQM